MSEAPIGLISLRETKRRTPNATQQVGCSALVFLNLRGDLQFHQCVARKSRDADRGTNVSPSVAEDLHEQSGCAVDDRRLCWNPATAFTWPFTPKIVFTASSEPRSFFKTARCVKAQERPAASPSSIVLSAPLVPLITPLGQVEIAPVRYTRCPIVLAVT